MLTVNLDATAGFIAMQNEAEASPSSMKCNRFEQPFLVIAPAFTTAFSRMLLTETPMIRIS
jgi:hypothetical protein